MSYNTLFETFVDNQPNKIKGYIAYGLYKRAKREWIQQKTIANGTPPGSADITAYAGMFTQQTIDTYFTQSEFALAEFADEAIENARADILRDALKGSAWKAIGLGVATNFVYTLILLGIVFVLKWAGVDFVGLVQSVSGPR